mmetsp:Transcript_26790/g.59553  ORF Transcript_26790/g.59553 Transcript_26790/m.59553 type:complete len:84 (-) Transcript_26790:698-949(-)
MYPVHAQNSISLNGYSNPKESTSVVATFPSLHLCTYAHTMQSKKTSRTSTKKSLPIIIDERQTRRWQPAGLLTYSSTPRAANK